MTVRLESGHCRDLMDIAAELHGSNNSQAVPKLVAEKLFNLVSSEFSACHRWVPNKQEVEPCYFPARPELPATHRRFVPLALRHPLTSRLFRCPGRAWRLSDALPLAAFRRTDFFNLLYRPLGIAHELTAVVPLDRDAFLICSLHRQRHDFSERDRLLMNLILPHVARAATPRKPSAVAQPRLSLEELRQAVTTRTNWRLKPREVEVLYWLGQGKSNPEIALILNISPRTAETHALRAYPRMGVENRYAATVTLLELEQEVGSQQARVS